MGKEDYTDQCIVWEKGIAELATTGMGGYDDVACPIPCIFGFDNSDGYCPKGGRVKRSAVPIKEIPEIDLVEMVRASQ